MARVIFSKKVAGIKSGPIEGFLQKVEGAALWLRRLFPFSGDGMMQRLRQVLKQ